MAVAGRCATCGAELNPDHLCPSCLIGLGIAAGAAAGTESAAAASTTPTAAALEQSIGPYAIRSVLGEGGMGRVYLAEQRHPLRRTVALKVIKLGMDSSEVISRFESERQALALLDHPNIASVFDAGTTFDGRPYFAMEHVVGQPITDYCDRLCLPLRARLELLDQVCQGVHHAHQIGIIHRDLKPSNLLVAETGGPPQIKIIDFGVAKALHGRLTERTLFTTLGVLLGTPEYMSPEQAELGAIDVDTRADIYSLGAVLHELLTGALPFDPVRLRRAGFSEIQRILREEEPLRPSERVGALGAGAGETARRRAGDVASLTRALRGDLDWITLKALDKDRDQRYASASELAADLRRYLADEPVSARPPTAAYRLKKLVRRRKGLVAAFLAVMTSLLVGLTTSVLLYRRAERAREENRRRLVQLQVESGLRLAEQGDFVAALPRLGQALTLSLDRPAEQEAQRIRWATTLAHCPKLIQLWLHRGPVHHAEFDPEGRRVLSASADGGAYLWDASSGAACLQPLQHAGDVLYATYSPDGTRIVTASADRTARLWDAASGLPLGRPLTHDGPVQSASFSRDGLLVATASKDHSARLWEVRSGRELMKLDHDDEVVSVAFNPSATLIVTASADRTARIWSTATGQGGPVLEHRDQATHALFSPDGSKVATASADRSARLWDAASGRPSSPPLAHDGMVYFAAFSPDGRWLATAAQDYRARVWDVETGLQRLAPLEHSNLVLQVRFSPDGQYLVSSCFDGTVRVWDASSGAPISPPLRHGAAASSASFAPDSHRIVVDSEDRTVRIWDLAAAAAVERRIDHGYPLYSVGFSPAGDRLVTAGGPLLSPTEGYARIWSLTGEPMTPPLRHGGPVFRASFSHDGARVVTASEDRSARVWDARSGEPLTALLLHPYAVNYAEFDPLGGRLVTACGDASAGAARVFDSASGRPLTGPLAHDKLVMTARFSPDGTRIVTASLDGSARLWDARTGRPLGAPLRHRAEVTSASFSPYGRRVLTSSSDRTARTWDAASGAPLRRLLHSSGLWTATFSPDGRRILTAAFDGSVQIWNADSGASRRRRSSNEESCRPPPSARMVVGSPPQPATGAHGSGRHRPAWLWGRRSCMAGWSATSPLLRMDDDGLRSGSTLPLPCWRVMSGRWGIWNDMRVC